MLKHLFSTSGRSGRLEYFVHSFADVFAIVIAAALFGTLPEQGDTATSGDNAYSAIGAILFSLALLLGMIVEVCVTVRRLHDLGKSGWHIVGTMIPIYNIYLGLMLVFMRGNPKENQYGPDPVGQ